MNPDLARRLRAAGVEPDAIRDPRVAFARLHAREGQRATLLDRYALESAVHETPVEELSDARRADLQAEVLRLHIPGWELVAGSDRSQQDPIQVVDYDPAWPEQYAGWLRRLQQELGETAIRIEHIGSTAVPGLAAKPIIDVQVTVPDVDDEAAYVPAVERAGIALRSRDPEHRYFRPAGDRPRDVQVHVYRAGSSWERAHLLFRDLLRSDADERDAYATLKRDAAARYRHDRIAYNEAKSLFILDALSRAEAWAAARGWTVERPA